jgi:hypothetical protein
MLRLVSTALAAVLIVGAAQAQTPDTAAKDVKVHAVLKGGAKIEVRQPDIIDSKLCGFILPADATPDATPKADCVAMSDIASTDVKDAKYALGESTEGALCVVLMPLCLAKVSAVQDRIVEKAIEKAQAR